MNQGKKMMKEKEQKNQKQQQSKNLFSFCDAQCTIEYNQT